MTDPKSVNNEMIAFGGDALNVKRIFGIKPEYFLEIYEQLKKRGLLAIHDGAKIQIDFVLYCNELLTLDFDISDLISEFNKAQKSSVEATLHALSLVKLAYHYSKAGFGVKIVRTTKNVRTPDLIIDNVGCELKVRFDQIYTRMQSHRHFLENKQTEEYSRAYFEEIRDIDEDLTRALERVCTKSFQQADCIFIDLSDHFHSWNYYRIKSYLEENSIKGISTIPIKPVPKYCIIFSPKNAMDLNEIGFKPQAYWGYVLWDQKTRIFIK